MKSSAMHESSDQPAVDRPRMNEDSFLCLICLGGGGDGDPLVASPKESSLTKLLECVHLRGNLGDKNCPAISRRLQNLDSTRLSSTSYHRRCYQETINPNDIARAKKRHEKAVSLKSAECIPAKIGRPSQSTVVSTSTYDEEMTVQPRTRSMNEQFNKELCFFCQVSNDTAKLHEVCTFNAGRKLRDAVAASNNDRWKIQLSAAVDVSDARAIDVKYHLQCWVRHVQ